MPSVTEQRVIYSSKTFPGNLKTTCLLEISPPAFSLRQTYAEMSEPTTPDCAVASSAYFQGVTAKRTISTITTRIARFADVKDAATASCMADARLTKFFADVAFRTAIIRTAALDQVISQATDTAHNDLNLVFRFQNVEVLMDAVSDNVSKISDVVWG